MGGAVYTRGKDTTIIIITLAAHDGVRSVYSACMFTVHDADPKMYPIPSAKHARHEATVCTPPPGMRNLIAPTLGCEQTWTWMISVHRTFYTSLTEHMES